MMVGVMLVAGSKRKLIIADGMTACAALMVAARIAPAVTDYCVYCRSHNHNGLDQALSLFQATAPARTRHGSTDGTGATLAGRWCAAPPRCSPKWPRARIPARRAGRIAPNSMPTFARLASGTRQRAALAGAAARPAGCASERPSVAGMRRRRALRHKGAAPPGNGRNGPQAGRCRRPHDGPSPAPAAGAGGRRGSAGTSSRERRGCSGGRRPRPAVARRLQHQVPVERRADDVGRAGFCRRRR